MKAGLYARVSTDLQETENQLIDLKNYCRQRQWDFEEYVDRGYSGALPSDERPALKSLLEAARRRKIDAVISWDLSRLARSTRQLIDMSEDFRTWGIQLIVMKGGFDTTTAHGRMMFGMLAVIAEFERELIRERVMLGLQRAKLEGKILGRKDFLRELAEEEPDKCPTVELLAVELSGKSVREATRLLNGQGVNVSRETVRRWFLKGEIPTKGLTQKPIPILTRALERDADGK